MSLPAAIETIAPRLPDALREEIRSKLDTGHLELELSVPYFAVSHVRSFDGLKFIFERRLIGCESLDKEKWLREKLAFLDESRVAGTTQDLWNGYLVEGESRFAFLIDASRKTFCIGPFP